MKSVIPLLLLLFSFHNSVFGETWDWPENTKFLSQNKIYEFDVVPHQKFKQTEFCIGTLTKATNGKKEVIWTKPLVNIPVEVYLPNSGAFVVTVDRWHQAGANPIVIYNHKGDLICAHSLTTLGVFNLKNFEKIDRGLASFFWHDKSISFFIENKDILNMNDQFHIRLHFNQWLSIRLHDGKVLSKEDFPGNEWEKFKEERSKILRSRIIEILKHGDKKARASAMNIARQEGFANLTPTLSKPR